MRFIQNNKCIRKRSPAHKRQRRDFDLFFFDQTTKLLSGQKVPQSIVERLHVAVDLVLHVTGQKAQTLARLDRRSRQDNLVHLSRQKHGNAYGDRKIGLARPCRANAEGQLMIEKRLHIGFLGIRAWLHPLFSGLDFDAIADRHFELRGVFRVRNVFEWAHAQFPVHITGFHEASTLQSRIKRVQYTDCVRLPVMLTHN